MPEMKKVKDLPLENLPVEQALITPDLLTISDEFIALRSSIPLKTVSSGVIGSGTGWNRSFVNRHVDKSYDCSDHQGEMADYLWKRGFHVDETVGMMTAVFMEDASCKFYQEEGFSVLVVVTAGIGNAVDVSKGGLHPCYSSPGTINTWVFVNGELTDEAFIQGVMTATEAKSKALHALEVVDKVGGTIATGTSTDSVMIAATQEGKKLPYAGSISELGRVIGEFVFACTCESIRKSMKRASK